MTHLVIIGAVVILGRLVFIYYHPFGPCRKCSGKGTNLFSTGKRSGDCRRCGGTRRTQRPGSRAVHQVVRGTSDAARKRKRKK